MSPELSILPFQGEASLTPKIFTERVASAASRVMALMALHEQALANAAKR
jgi:hypothetical protein